MKEITECIGDIGRANSTIFLTLDLTSGFWQMQLDEKSQHLTAFTIPGQGQRISGKFDAEILINELETMTKEAKEEPLTHWIFTTPGAMLGGAILSLLLLFCCWRTCCSSGNNSYPAPSAPPAPTVILNRTVEPIIRHDPFH
jgi:hypothetical protein